MNWNIFYAVAIGILTVSGAGLAGYLAAQKKWHKWFFWASGLVIVVLIFFQARSQKEPATVDQIANAVVVKMRKTQDIPPTLTAGNKQIEQHSGKPLKPLSIAKKHATVAYNPHPEESSTTPARHEARKGGETSNEAPAVSPIPPYVSPLNPPIQAHLTVTQSFKISTRSDAPVEQEIVVQTDTTFPSLKFVMQCNGPLVDAIPMIGGSNAVAQMAVSRGIVPSQPNLVVYSYGSSTPPFGPANPLVIDVWSKKPVTCKQVKTF